MRTLENEIISLKNRRSYLENEKSRIESEYFTKYSRAVKLSGILLFFFTSFLGLLIYPLIGSTAFAVDFITFILGLAILRLVLRNKYISEAENKINAIESEVESINNKLNLLEDLEALIRELTHRSPSRTTLTRLSLTLRKLGEARFADLLERASEALFKNSLSNSLIRSIRSARMNNAYLNEIPNAIADALEGSLKSTAIYSTGIGMGQSLQATPLSTQIYSTSQGQTPEPPYFALILPSGNCFAYGVHKEFGRNDFTGILDTLYINYISRKHFRIYKVGNTFYIEDLGSSNGTFVNGVDIRGKGPVELHHGDEISIANILTLMFIIYT